MLVQDAESPEAGKKDVCVCMKNCISKHSSMVDKILILMVNKTFKEKDSITKMIIPRSGGRR